MSQGVLVTYLHVKAVQIIFFLYPFSTFSLFLLLPLTENKAKSPALLFTRSGEAVYLYLAVFFIQFSVFLPLVLTSAVFLASVKKEHVVPAHAATHMSTHTRSVLAALA